MSAIAGIVSKNNKPITSQLLLMLQTMTHRGNGYYININGQPIYCKNLTDVESSISTGTIGIGSNVSNSNQIGIQSLASDSNYCIIDGEVYNYSELLGTKEYQQDNEYEIFSNIFEKYFDDNQIKRSLGKLLIELDGGFSFAVLNVNKNRIIVARDILGIKPLYIAENEVSIAFASELKALWQIGFTNQIRAIEPGDCITITSEGILSYNFRVNLKNEIKNLDFESCLKKLDELLLEAISKRVSGSEVAILFSGGLDSSCIAKMTNDLGVDVQLFVACFKGSKDEYHSKLAAASLGLPLSIAELTDEKIKKELHEIIYHLEDPDTLAVEIALPLHFACGLASERGYKYVFSGQGADELFAGYNRYERILKKNNYQYLHEMLFKDVLNLWHHDIIRDDKISMGNSIELKMPYLDLHLVKFGLSIPPEFKLKQLGNNFVRKYILKTLGKRRGLDRKLLNLPKVAVQYGSGASKGLKRIGMKLGIDNERAKALGFSNTIDALTNIVFSELGYSKTSITTIPDSLLAKIRSWK